MSALPENPIIQGAIKQREYWRALCSSRTAKLRDVLCRESVLPKDMTRVLTSIIQRVHTDLRNHLAGLLTLGKSLSPSSRHADDTILLI